MAAHFDSTASVLLAGGSNGATTMKISRIETIRVKQHPQLCWVQVHGDDGLVGLGETFFGAAAVEAYLHETAAPLLLGRDALAIDRISQALIPYVGFAST